jgi:serralysin
VLTPTLRRCLLTAAAVTLVPLTALSPAPAVGAVGPDCDNYAKTVPSELAAVTEHTAILTKERCGYRFRAGRQDSNLEVTDEGASLLFHDKGTTSWKSVAKACQRVSVTQGVAARCPVSSITSSSNAMLLEIWPRLGNDHVDASSLPAKFQVSALMDGGNDVVFGGAGNDFVNGGAGADTVRAGGGDDLVHGGGQADDIDGGTGADKIYGHAGPDMLEGGPGVDLLYGGDGGDVLSSGDSEYDVANCGAGADQSTSDQADKRSSCERVTLFTPDPGTDSDTTPDQDEWGTGEFLFPDGTTTLPKKAGKIPGVGPSSPYVQEILTHDVVPMKNQAMINPVPNGYLVRAGQQHSDMIMTVVDGRLQIVDRGTAEWKGMPAECRNVSVPKGVGASCVLPDFFTDSNPMLIEVWPRIGDDTIDTRTLSTRFEISFLGDKGDDVAYLGAGKDFFNGAQEADTVYGGDGRDWLRTGLEDDIIHGEGGADELVGVDGNDTIYGGPGNDNIAGNDGHDKIYAGSGTDRVGCGAGTDTAWALVGDSVYQCETVNWSS